MELNQLFSVNKNNFYFLAVLEPLQYNMKHLRVKFEEFSFVFSARSEALREHVATYCQKLYLLRKSQGYNASSIIDFRKRMKTILSPSGICKDEAYVFDLTYLFFDLAYYTAGSQDKNAHFRKFSIFHGAELLYYYYVGSNDVDITTVPDKIEQRLKWSNNHAGECSFITNIPIV